MAQILKMKKEYKYKSSFSAQLKPIVSKEVDKYLALASEVNFKKFLPKDIDFSEKIDFLGFAGEAFIANRLNLNDDGVSTDEAIRLANLFPLSFIDVDHDRSKLAGVVVNASYAEFGTGKELTLDDVKKTNTPFSVVIGGIVWRIPNPKFAEAIEESSDPNSEYYNKFFLSWEVLFSDAKLIVMDKKQSNFEDGKIISEAGEISKLENKVKAFGGEGFTDDGKRIGRVIIGDCVPTAVGIVESPAANVKPISIASDNLKKDEKTNSQSPKQPVNNNIIKNKSIKNMIKSIKDINDEVLKEATASEIIKAHKVDLDAEIQKISDDWEAKKGAGDKELKASNDKITDLEKATKETNDKLAKATEDLEKLAKANADREQEEIFNTRMNYFDSEYDLEDEKIRNIVARKIKGADEATYNEAKEEIELLLAAKKKSGKVFDKKTMKWVDPKEVEDKKESKETKASIEIKDDVVDTAIDNGEKTKAAVAATTAPTVTKAEEWSKAFGEDGWEIEKRAFRR